MNAWLNEMLSVALTDAEGMLGFDGSRAYHPCTDNATGHVITWSWCRCTQTAEGMGHKNVSTLPSHASALPFTGARKRGVLVRGGCIGCLCGAHCVVLCASHQP